MASELHEQAEGAAIGRDLSLPHDRFSPWTRRETYDRVAAMYLDCWDDAAIARDLSVELKRDITPELVHDVRVEAASEAQAQPHDTRLRWIYRFRRLTVNNLVTEYMFIEGQQQFLQAKLALAKEIEALVKSTAAASLCIAVNDALGRNNVGMDLLEKLQSYASTARKMDALVRSRPREAGRPPEKAVEDVAAKVASWHDSQAGRDPHKTAAYAGEVLRQPPGRVTAEDVEYLLDCWRLRHDDGSTDVSLADRIARGGDGGASAPSLLEQVLDDGGIHLAYTALRQLAENIRGGAVLKESDLTMVQQYAARHVKDIETRRAVGQRSNVPEAVQKVQLSALQALHHLAAQHLDLLDHKAFFTPQECAQAAQRLIPPADLQAVLDRLNGLTSRDEIKAVIASLSAKVKRFEFPLDRYLEKRFRMPSPEAK